MIRTVNGVEREWTPEIEAAWKTVGAEDATRANWFTARPYVDQYNRGSDREGFVFCIKHGYYTKSCIREQFVGKPIEPYLNPRGKWR